MTKSVELELDKIRIDGGTQPRAKIDMETVADYHAAFELGANFPPIDVFFDGKEYWLADGFHRWHGARAANLGVLDAIVHKGTVRDAILFAVGANSSHGLKRTSEDKRQAVKLLLSDPEWIKWSDRSIAEKCGVGHQLVATVRQTMDESSVVSERKFKTSTGKESTRKVEPPKPRPEPAQAPTTTEQPAQDSTVPTETEAEAPAEPAREESKPRGVGVERAHEAIACLKRIPVGDALRKRAFEIVTDWIKHNK